MKKVVRKFDGLSLFVSAVLIPLWACGPQPVVVGGPKREAVKMGDVTLQNMLQFPDGRDYIEAPGHGAPPEGEKDAEVRRRIARESAVIDAEKKLIQQLSRMAPRKRIQDILRQAQLGTIQYGYDDACNLTLRISREAVEGKEPLKP